MNERSIAARSACPSSKASHSATATPSNSTSKPVAASASQLGTSPSGMTRIALLRAKNSVATATTPATRAGCPGLRTAATIAPSVDTEIDREHHPMPKAQWAIDASRQSPHPTAPPRRPPPSASSRGPCYARYRSDAPVPARRRTRRSPAPPPDRSRCGSTLLHARRRATRTASRATTTAKPHNPMAASTSTGLRGSRDSRYRPIHQASAKTSADRATTVQTPNRRCRRLKSRNARRKSTRRKSGQCASVNHISE